jgi:hypothetical protein
VSSFTKCAVFPEVVDPPDDEPDPEEPEEPEEVPDEDPEEPDDAPEPEDPEEDPEPEAPDDEPELEVPEVEVEVDVEVEFEPLEEVDVGWAPRVAAQPAASSTTAESTVSRIRFDCFFKPLSLSSRVVAYNQRFLA